MLSPHHTSKQALVLLSHTSSTKKCFNWKMPVKTTVIGAWPKPDYLGRDDWFVKSVAKGGFRKGLA